MIVQKLLLTFENWETTVKLNEGVDNEIRAYIQANPDTLEVYQADINEYNPKTGFFQLRGSKVVSEVEDLGGFSFAAGNPDYTLMQLRTTASVFFQVDSVIDTDIISVFTFPEPILDTLGVIMSELIWKDVFAGEAEETMGVVVDATASIVRQPFHLVISSTDETGAGNNDGTIDVDPLTSWGGTNPLKYSLDAGPFQNFTSFTGLTPGVHTIQGRDADSMLSEVRNITINPGP